MAIKLAIANQKGGVGKTSTALALAYGYTVVEPEKKILFVDLDSQGNATAILSRNKRFQAHESIYSVFSGEKMASAQIHESSKENLLYCPSSLKMAEIDSLLANKLDGFFRLNDGLSKVETEFDIIILDCPPSLSIATINALVCAHYLITPLQVSKFSLDGIQVMQDAVDSVKKRYNPALKILGGLLTMYDGRTTLSQAMLPELEKHLRIFQSKIPKSVILEEAHLMKENIFDYAPDHKLTQSYLSFTKEVLSSTS